MTLSGIVIGFNWERFPRIDAPPEEQTLSTAPIEKVNLTPRLVGERIGLSPLAVIFALLAFGHLFGFAGVLVALPLSAVLVVAVGRLRSLYVQSRLYGSS